MITVISLVASKVLRSQVGRLLVLGVLCLLVGAEAFALTQHQSFGIGLYWAITTATTVGYGDVTPKNDSGRIVASLVMVTTIPLFAAAFASFAGAVASAHLRRLLGMERDEPGERHVVVFGTHPAVPASVAEIRRAGREVLVVSTADRASLPDDVRVVRADPTTEEGIRRGRPERASQVLIAGVDDAAVLVTSVLVHQVAPKTPAMAVVSSPNVSRALHDLGIDAVSAEELLAHTLAKSLEAPHAGELLLRILDSDGVRLEERSVDDGAGQRLSALRATAHGVVIGAVKDGRVVVGVTDDPVLSAGDRLLVLAADR